MLLRAFAAPAVLAALFATPAVAGPGGPGTRARPAEVTVVATEYHFAAPASVPAGPTAIQLENRGKEVHHLALLRLEQGKTLDDLKAALANPGPPPAWVVFMGGPNAVNPGSSDEAVVDLTPGQYVLACFVPGPDGVPHAAHGMISPLTVTAAQGQPAQMPAADLTVKLANYGFSFSSPLTAGPHRVLVRNTDTQWHEMVLFHLQEGKTAKDLLDWSGGGMKTPPPGDFVGGISPLGPGQENVDILDLQPGHYAVLCFLDDKGDGKPHFMHGMVQELTLE
jgi:uncharacterized cupredoxin-like copper-binding protein